MSENTNPIIYLDGEFVSYRDATVSVSNRGFLFGHGVYEVMRIVGGHIFEFEAHINRLKYSLEMVGLEFGGGADEIKKITVDLIEKNNLPDATIYWQFSAGGCRVSVTYTD